jgi:hypothetical protein
MATDAAAANEPRTKERRGRGVEPMREDTEHLL